MKKAKAIRAEAAGLALFSRLVLAQWWGESEANKSRLKCLSLVGCPTLFMLSQTSNASWPCRLPNEIKIIWVLLDPFVVNHLRKQAQYGPKMPEEPPVTLSGPLGGALASASDAEKNARFDTSGRNGNAPLKLRSCVVCRSRKVRCDKRAPCSNCRRANIACVRPPTDRPPRWARHLDRLDSAVSSLQASQEPEPVAEDVMERLHNLESLVQELRIQLEQAKSVVNSAAEGSSGVGSPEGSAHDRQSNPSSINTTNVQTKFGRLVLQDSNRSRYVSSGFWSRVNDEVCRLGLRTLLHGMNSRLISIVARWSQGRCSGSSIRRI